MCVFLDFRAARSQCVAQTIRERERETEHKTVKQRGGDPPAALKVIFLHCFRKEKKLMFWGKRGQCFWEKEEEKRQVFDVQDIL